MVDWRKVGKLFEKTDAVAILLLPHASKKFRECNFQWLTGIYQPVTCQAVVTPDEMLIVAIEQEADFIKNQIGKDEKVTVLKPGEDKESYSKLLKDKKVGIDATQLPRKYFDELTKMLGGLIKDPVDISDIFYELRVTKDETEIDKIKTAAHICSSVRSNILETIKIGTSEAKVYSDILSGLSMPRKYNNEEVFSKPEYVRVAFGGNTVLDHPEPTNKRLELNTVGYFDIAGSCSGYNSFLSDCIETDSVKEMDEAHSTLGDALNKAVELMVPGMKCRKIYHETSKILNENYRGRSYFMGSPIGLEIHEPPFPNKYWIQPSPNGGSGIPSNSTYWLIFGIHDLKGGWGVRISETVLVDKSRCEILT